MVGTFWGKVLLWLNLALSFSWKVLDLIKRWAHSFKEIPKQPLRIIGNSKNTKRSHLKEMIYSSKFPRLPGNIFSTDLSDGPTNKCTDERMDGPKDGQSLL